MLVERAEQFAVQQGLPKYLAAGPAAEMIEVRRHSGDCWLSLTLLHTPWGSGEGRADVGQVCSAGTALLDTTVGIVINSNKLLVIK